jgi:tetratricopeptide (TPR) repeat protein
MYRRVPSTRPDSGTNHRSGGVRDNISARTGNRYSRDLRRNLPPTRVPRTPTVSNRYTPKRPVTPGPRDPRLRDSGRVPTIRTGGGGRRPRTNNRQPRVNTRVNRTLARPRRAVRKYASHHYRYGGGHQGKSRNHHSALGGLLGLNWVHHLGWNSWSHYAYDPYYSNYYVGHGYHHYHWSNRFYHPLNYSDWWYPTTYYPVSYIYVNSRGDYSPYPSTEVITEVTEKEEDGSAPARAPEAAVAPAVEAEELSTETLIKRHVTLADFYFKEGRYSEASESYLRALAYAPEDATIHFVLADALIALGDYHYAAFVIQKALRLDPAMAFAEADKRTFYGDVKEFGKHMATIKNYVKEKPFDVAGQLVLGYNYKFSDQKENAIAAFRRVLEISPENQAAKLFVEALTEPPAKPDAKPGAKKGAKDSVKRTEKPATKTTEKPVKKAAKKDR